MITKKRKLGDLGEKLAAKFLEQKGYTIVERNFLKPWGEVDIVATKGGTVHFIEVKTVSRENMPDGSREIENRPEEHIDSRKLRKLARTASLYMESKGDDREYQIDAVGVILNLEKRIARCRLFEQVLEDNL